MYAGGTFTHVQDVVRGLTHTWTNLVAFDMITGIVSTTFNPVIAGGEVSGLATDGTWLYLGGAFTTVNGQATRVAKINLTTRVARSQRSIERPWTAVPATSPL